MKTDELVNWLASGPIAVAPGTARRRFTIALLAGGALSGALMLAGLGLNPALAAATGLAAFWLKFGFSALLGVAACVSAARLARPGARLARLPALIATPLLILWAVALASWLSADAAARGQLLFGATWRVCPWLIAALAAPLFVAAMWALRGLAPTRLRLAGAAAGMLSGACAATIYSLHCPELGPPFVACWYVLGIALPSAIGALLGPRLLRW